MMSSFWHEFISLDLPPILTALFSSLSCALIGNYLVLRRQSLMGDAISHAVLPGIVLAFLISGTRSSFAVFIGASIAGICSALLIEVIRKIGQVETGASMGVVFSIFFALGVLLMEQAAANNIDLDADCLLHGQLETIFWLPPENIFEIIRLSTLSQLPNEVFVSLAVFVFISIFIILFYKELKLFSFDEALAKTLGFNPSVLYYVFISLTAFSVVAAFKAVGSILVIAMIICPATTARLFTDKLKTQIFLSMLFTIIATIAGYVCGAFMPIWFGFENSINTAGMISVISGLLLLMSVFLAPRYGILAQKISRHRLQLQVIREDILGLIYRVEETKKGITKDEIVKTLRKFSSDYFIKNAYNSLLKNGFISERNNTVILTETGNVGAVPLLRKHRLWETYLVNRVGLNPDHVHNTAEALEHYTDQELTEKLQERVKNPETDPHGKKIP